MACLESISGMVPRMAEFNLAKRLSQLTNQISTVIVGKKPQIEDCIACLLAGGHLLIEDVPGVGKTTLAHQIMFALATPERPALYFTVLGEPPLKMLRYQQQFAFFDIDKINAAVRFVNLSSDLMSGDFDRRFRRSLCRWRRGRRGRGQLRQCRHWCRRWQQRQ